MRRLLLLTAAVLALGGLAWLLLSDERDAEPPAVAENSAAPAEDAAGATKPGAPAPPSPGQPQILHVQARSGLTLRIQRNARIEMPGPPYGPLYEKLKDRVEQGSPREQYQFGLLLYECRDAPADEAELAHQIEQVHQTRRLNGWDVSDPAQEEQSLRRGFAECAGIPRQARMEHRDWMKRAADNGLIEAQLNLMYYLPKAEYCQFIEDCSVDQAQFMSTLREEARANVNRALDGGSVEALRTVGSWALNEEMGPPDSTEAYAYLSAYDQVQQAAGRERELVSMLEQLRTHLRPVDLQTAEAKARELLSNPNCCVLTR